MTFLLTDTFNPDNPIAWVQWGGVVGVLLLLVVGFLKGWIVSGRTYQAEVDRRTQVEADNQEQVIFFRDQVMPLLTRTQDVLTKTLEERAWDERLQKRRPS